MKLHPASLLWLFALSVIIAGCEDTQPTAVNADLEGTQNVTDSFSKRSKPSGSQAQGDPAVLAMMNSINVDLASSGLNYAIESIDFFTIGVGRPSNRIHQGTAQWVAGDTRRAAQGNDITYLVDQSDGATTSGLNSAQTESAIDVSITSWSGEKSLAKVNIVKRADSGADPDILDGIFGFGGSGDPFLADVVEAGWLPRAFFEAVGGPGGGDEILAFSASFIFIDGNGNPTDIDGDGYLDKALNEVYYNDTFGTPGDPREAFPWGIGVARPGVDVESVALHENGHSLGLGHFGPPPSAVMNPVYAGVVTSPLSTDNAAMSTVWRSWPKK